MVRRSTVVAGTASTICQLVADSPFTPGNTC
jgi:hypothetical protein